ncbi:hypothetical protein CLU95_3555 [Variovorax sp. 54]|nr:hypothetical protein CLU95_3555 [Variovorax sp. 54]
MRAGLSFAFRGRVSPRRATHFLLLRQKKVSKEKATPLSATLRFAAGNLRCSRFAGSRRTRFAQTAASPDPRNAPLLGAARGDLDTGRAFASLGLGSGLRFARRGTCSLSPWGEGGGEGIGLHAREAVFLCRGPSPPPSPQGEREQCKPSEAKAREVFRCRAKRWPVGIPTPSVCAEERSVSRIRARSCLSEASLGETPRNVSTAGCPQRSAGTQTAGSPFFCLRFFGEAKKSRSAAGPRPGLGKQPPNAVQRTGASR